MSGKKNKCKDREKGQAVVEFGILLPILIILLLVPVDLYRYANVKMILKSAASESISRLTYMEISGGNSASAIRQTVKDYFGDKLDTGRVTISHLELNPSSEEKYTYYVYSSEKANNNPGNFQAQFDRRDSSYECIEVELQMTYTLNTVTPWGNLFLDDPFKIVTPVYSRNIYVNDYIP